MEQDEKKVLFDKLKALAIPLALQSLLNSLVGASDALMLGRLNQDSISAVALANLVFCNPSFPSCLFRTEMAGAYRLCDHVPG